MTALPMFYSQACLRMNEMYREDLISIVQIAATYAILVTAFALWLL